MVFIPKPQFRGRKLALRTDFLLSNHHTEPSSLFQHPDQDPHRHEHAQEGAHCSSQCSESKQWHPLQKTSPPQLTRVSRRITTKAFKGLKAQSSTCTSANPRPSELQDGFPVFKEFRSAVLFKCNNFKIQTQECTHVHMSTYV